MNDSRHVTLFIQCLVDTLYPQAGEAMVRLFERLGITMDCPTDQTCCGQPAFNAGYWTEAKSAAKRFITLFENAGTIVCPSGSCVDMVRNHYPDLFNDEPAWQKRAIAIGKRTWELTEYLVDILDITDVGASFSGAVTYHDSCHLSRNLKVASQPRKLIKNVRNCTLIEMKNADRCCGFGGTFAVNYPDISTAILEEKVNAIIDSGADAVVGCDISCLMNIQGMLNRKKPGIRTLHIAQLLAGGDAD